MRTVLFFCRTILSRNVSAASASTSFILSNNCLVSILPACFESVKSYELHHVSRVPMDDERE